MPRQSFRFMILLVTSCVTLCAQSVPASFSVTTPRPISPAEGTTTPSARETQRQNPFLGSTPAANTHDSLYLSLHDAVSRGLRYNLGLVESQRASADVHAERLRAMSALLPQLSATGRQGFEDLSYKEIGLRLPPIPGLSPLPSSSGGFGYQDARIVGAQEILNLQLRARYQAAKQDEKASDLSIKDARDVVVLAVGTAYFQVIASAARVETVKAQLAAARELDTLTAHRVTSEVSPEIDSLRAQVEHQSEEQRLTDATNQLEKDRLTLGRLIGLAIEQKFELAEASAVRVVTLTSLESATEEAFRTRADLASASAAVQAAASILKAQKAQRLPVVSVTASYGGAGANIANFAQVYTVSGNVTVPIYTGGRIRADIGQAESDLARKQAEYDDLRGRIAYDVRVAYLDAKASESSLKVAEANRQLAQRALTQSQDRYSNGVTNFLEVVQAQQVVAAANENCIQTQYSFNVAIISLARAMGNADSRLPVLLGEQQ